MKRTGAEALQIKGPHWQEKGNNKERVDAEAIHIERPQRDEDCDKKESGRRGYADQGPTEGEEGRQ